MASDTRHRRPPDPPNPDPPNSDRLDKLAAFSQKMTRRAAKLEQVAEKHQQAAAKLSAKAEALERSTERLAALDLWTRKAPTARRPRFTREEIAETAIDIADAEGFGAVSMRRIASELASGTMTLYHYVRTKDELLTLVVDAMMGEIVVPEDEFPDNWRDAITTIAERTRASLIRHPWILDITDDPPVGPNSVRHFDQSLQAVAALPIDLQAKFDIVSSVDAYVFGFCLHERNNLQGDDQFEAGMTDYVNDLIGTGEYPQLALLAGEYGLDQTWTELDRYFRDAGRFGRGLDHLLDGIEASLPRE